MIPLNPNLHFKEDTHQYFYNGKELISPTTLIHYFCPPFDPTGEILINKSKKLGVTPEELQAEWKQINLDSIIKGKIIHNELEHFINTREIRNSQYKSVVEQFSKIKFQGNLQSEVRLFHLKSRICGTADLIEFLGDGFVHLWDFKSNRRLNKYCPYKNKMLAPFNHLYAHHFNIYGLQLGLYSFMLEEMGYWVKEQTLIHINPKNQKLEQHTIQFMPREIKRLTQLAKTFLD